MQITLHVDPSLTPNPAKVALVWGTDLPAQPASDGLPTFLARAAAEAAAHADAYWPAGRKAAVRDMLRYGVYKPSGRAKPASEFLLQAAIKGAFPAVNPLVDVNNFISLTTGFPCSVFDADLVGPELLLRRGEPGEEYLFNTAGHTIRLQDLLLLCRRVDGSWQPCGNPVKDAMITKTSETTRNVVAALFAPAERDADDLVRAASHYAELLVSHCRAGKTGVFV